MDVRLFLPALLFGPPGCRPEPRVDASNPAGIAWVDLPGGSFQMGSENTAVDEVPVHVVVLSPFAISRTEVTVALYRRCVQAGACTEPDKGDDCNWAFPTREDHPINCVDWDQARAFAAWAGGRLPTEAEWEYAARDGGKNQVFPWGDEPADCDRTVLSMAGTGCGRLSTWPVCSKPEGNTARGLCDMAGNLWEWTSDWYGTYQAKPVIDPMGPETGTSRVHRGGSWYDPPKDMRAATRLNCEPGVRGNVVGIRVVRAGNGAPASLPPTP